MSIIQSKLDAIQRIIHEEFSQRTIPGLAVGIVENNQLVFGQGYGYANVEAQQPVTTNTVFKLGSISKLFTCIGLLQQWEQGKFNLEDPVNDYLPRGKIITKKGWPRVTFLHLFTHTAGIGELRRFTDIFRKGFRLLTYGETPVPPLNSFHDLHLYPSAPAGLKYAYSNIGGSLLGYLIEIFSGEPFCDYMERHILDPLKMNQSGFVRSEKIRAIEAQGYKLKKGKLHHAKYWNNIISPSGGLYSNLEDISKFAICLLNESTYSGGRLLKPETLEMAWTPHYWSHDCFKKIYSIGLLFRIYNANGKRFLGHTGGTSGFTATFNLFPANNLAFVCFCNLSELLHDRITLRIRNRLFKLITEIPNTFQPTLQPDKSYWSKIKGNYGSYPGFLSNTRILVDGIEFKIREYDNQLVFSSLIGACRKGIPLYPTTDPLVYEYPLDDGADYYHSMKIGFTCNDQGTIRELGKDYHKLRKIHLFQTFLFKLSFLASFITISIILLVVLL